MCHIFSLRYCNKKKEGEEKETVTVEKIMVAVGKRWTQTGVEFGKIRSSVVSVPTSTERTSHSTTSTSGQNTTSSAVSQTDPMQLEEFSELRESMLDSEYM